MANSRYTNRRIIGNKSKLVTERSEGKPISYIAHYVTPKLIAISPSVASAIITVPHVWAMGDRYGKLAFIYYGDTKYWWIIARFNQKPTEHHIIPGQLIKIPLPLEKVLETYGA